MRVTLCFALLCCTIGEHTLLTVLHAAPVQQRRSSVNGRPGAAQHRTQKLNGCCSTRAGLRCTAHVHFHGSGCASNQQMGLQRLFVRLPLACLPWALLYTQYASRNERGRGSLLPIPSSLFPHPPRNCAAHTSPFLPSYRAGDWSSNVLSHSQTMHRCLEKNHHLR